MIKAILADALGMHLDQFQRIVVDPASISVVSYTETRPFVVRVNDTGGDLTGLLPPKRDRRPGARSAAGRRGTAAVVAPRCVAALAPPRNLWRVPRQVYLFERPSGSSPAPWVSPVTAPSTCRPPTRAVAPSASRWRRRRSRSLADR